MTFGGRKLNHTYVVETGWLAAGFVSKLLIQMGTLYYLTANLGRDGTGTFFALLAVFACLVPFVQLGNYDLTVRDIARQQDPRAVSGRAMRSSAAAFVVMLPVLLLLRTLLAKDVGWAAFLLVAAGELLVSRVMSNVQAVATGFRLHYVAAVCDFLMGLSRFVAVYVAAKLHAGVDAELSAYAFTSIPASAAAYAWLVWKCGSPHWSCGRLFTDFADHRRMTTAWLAELAAGQGDKALLKLRAGVGDVGIYGTASKLFGVVIVPVDVLTQVFRPRISAAYAEGEAGGRAFGRKMSVVLVGSGALAGVGLFLVAWLLPRVLPRLAHSDFGDARVALMYLSVLPPLYGLQRANVITAIARGATGAYSTAVLISAAAGLGTLAVTAPAFGWRGACLGYGVYTATSAIALWQLGRRNVAGSSVPAGARAELEMAHA